MFDKAWKIVTGLAALALLVVGVVYFATRETPRKMHPLLQEVASESVAAFSEQIPKVRDLDTLLLIVAGRGPRDEEAQFRSMLEDQLLKASKYRLKTWADVERLVGDNLIAQLQEKIGLVSKQPPHSLEKAIDALKYLDVANFQTDGVLFVDVEEFTEGEGGLGSRISLSGVVWSQKAKKVEAEVPRQTRSIDSEWDHRYLSWRITNSSVIVRALVWFAASALLPWAAIGVVRRVVRLKHNGLNLAMLAGFTALDLVLAFVLLCALTLGPSSLVLLLFVAAAMGYYNYDACDYIERRLQ